MVDRFAKAMTEGKEYAADNDFAEACAAFAEALKYKPDSPEAHYYFAFTAAENIGAQFLSKLTDIGVTLGGMHIAWREALDPSFHAQVTARIEKAHGKAKLLLYKMAVAYARRKIATQCMKHLRIATTMRPHYTFAQELQEKLEPLAEASPLSMVAAILS
jgi:hypothetical protein